MRVIESFTSSKTGNEDDNEDTIVSTSHYAAIIDGATRARAIRINGAAPGRLIAQSIGRKLKQLEAGLAGAELIDCISRHVRDELWPLAGHENPSQMFNASVIIHTASSRTVTSVGDCLCRIGDEIHADAKAIDQLLSETRSLFNRLTRLAAPDLGQANDQRQDPGRELILPVLELQPLLANSDNCPGYNYGVINGNAVPDAFINVWPVKAGAEVVLASDGYLLPAATLEDAETALQKRLREDPGMDSIRPFGTKGVNPARPRKGFDDRSYLRFVVE
jgi:hypothetical protein